MAMIVYVVTNTKNGKRYVGQTVRSLAARWAVHVSYAKRGSNTYFHKALRKHGADAFTMKVVYACSEKQSLDFYEQAYISLLDTRNPERGYNLTGGGEGTLGRVFSKATREKMSADRKGNKNCAGRRLSENTKQLIRASRARYFSSPEGIAFKELLRTNPAGNLNRKGRML